MGYNYQDTNNRYAINSISQNYHTSWGKVDTSYITVILRIFKEDILDLSS